MKPIVRKLITVSLALLLCLLPMAAQAQSLLGERLAMAFETGRTIEVVVKLDIDDSLGMLGFMTPEDLAALQELLRATTLKFTATQAASDRLEIGFELLNREFKAHGERRVLLTDITYAPRYNSHGEERK